jgi:hypothetical protein
MFSDRHHFSWNYTDASGFLGAVHKNINVPVIKGGKKYGRSIEK